MKTNVLLTMMAAAAFSFTLLSSCNMLTNTGDPDKPGAAYNGIGLPQPRPQTPLKAEVIGNIDPEEYDKETASVVTFNRIPYDLDEFNEVYAAIGDKPAGAVAMLLMAMEMYHRQHDVGLQALELCNTPGDMKVRYGEQLNQLYMINDATGYARPYQVASFLKGANYLNGYAPETPYTIEIKTDPAKPYAWSNDYEAHVIYLRITQSSKVEKGPDVILKTQGVSVVMPAGKDKFQVFEGAGLITQCVKISATATYKDLI